MPCRPLVSDRPEGHGDDDAGRPLDEGAEALTTVRECGLECRGMLGDPAMVRPGVGNHQGARDGLGRPAHPTGDSGRQTALAIERPDGLGDVDNLRLDLDDEKGSGRRMPAKNVDEAPLTTNAERHFRAAAPTGGGERGDQGIDEARMAGARDPFDVPGPRPDAEIQASLQDPDDTPDRSQAQLLEMATFDSDTVASDTPARTATSIWRSPRRICRTRSRAPTRWSSIAQSIANGASRRLITVRQFRTDVRSWRSLWMARWTTRHGPVEKPPGDVHTSAASVDEGAGTVG